MDPDASRIETEGATIKIRVKYETVCAACGRKVKRGEVATWASEIYKRDEYRQRRRILCHRCYGSKAEQAV